MGLAFWISGMGTPTARDAGRYLSEGVENVSKD
jgi:hypothetical protein